jgi:hypothetical protein
VLLGATDSGEGAEGSPRVRESASVTAHDVDGLRERVPESWLLRSEPLALSSLTVWTEQGRYPLDVEDASDADARTALATARAVLEAVVRDLRGHGLELDETA